MFMRRTLSILIGLLALLFFTTESLAPLAAEEPEATKPLVFRKLTEEDRQNLDKAGLTIGDYLIVADAVKQLRKVYTLELQLNEIQHFDWSQPKWDKKNAELTVRQSLNIQTDQASAWYAGTRKRGRGEIARRTEKYTDIELGDQSLGNALMCVVMGTMWGVPLEVGQEARINAIIQQRLDLIAAKEAKEKAEE